MFLAGFVRRVRMTATGNGWDHLYDLSYFFGFLVSGFLHWALHTLCPTAKQTGSSPFEMELHRSGEQVSEEDVVELRVGSEGEGKSSLA